jgi:hypothetical protein
MRTLFFNDKGQVKIMGDDFNNKDIINMIMEFKSDIKGLQTEIKQTQNLLKSYNGLRQKMIDFEIDIATLKKEIATKELCKKDNKNDWKWTLGWFVAVGSLVLSIIINFL